MGYFQPSAHDEIQSRLNVPFKLRTRARGAAPAPSERRWWVRETHDGRACSELCPTILTPHRGWLTAEGRVCAPLRGSYPKSAKRIHAMSVNLTPIDLLSVKMTPSP